MSPGEKVYAFALSVAQRVQWELNLEAELFDIDNEGRSDFKSR